MTRILLFALLLGALPTICCGQRWVMIAPRQEFVIRHSLRDREELKPLAAEYNQIIAARLQTLTLDQITNVFGPKLETVRDLNFLWLTNRVALPLFAPDSLALSGLVVTNDQSHADLYAVGDVGYVELIYQWDGGTEYARRVLCFRPDATFVPLKTEDDFYRRLDWEKSKWLALKKWLDAHLPKAATQNEQR